MMKKSMWVVLSVIIALIILGFVFIPLYFLSHSADGIASGHLDIIAHRGASGTAPENTLPAIDIAISQKADGIEVDVHLSKDKKVVVMHDYTVDRTTNGTGHIAELTSEYIKSLDAGSWFGKKYSGVHVPFLEEVIEKVNGRAKLLIEIKKKGETDNGIEKEVAGLIEKYKAEKWIVVQSFNDKSLERIHNGWPGIELQKLFVFKFRFLPYVFDGKITYFDFKKYEYVSAFNMHYLFTEDGFLKEIHARGKKANAWGCRNRGSCKLQNMSHWDGLITNYPGAYKKQ